MERKFGIRFPPGYNRRVRFMAHAHDPLRYIHKPLLVHASGELLRILTSCALYSMGFSTGVHQVTGPWNFDENLVLNRLKVLVRLSFSAAGSTR